MDGGLLYSVACSLVAAILFARAGGQVLLRSHSSTTRPGAMAFGLWWGALASILATDAARMALGFMPVPSPEIYLALAGAKMLLMAGAITALGAYVLFLWTGTTRGTILIGFVAIAHAAYLWQGLLARLPATIEVATWSTRMHLQPPQGVVPPPMQALLFFLPAIILAAAYAPLWWRLEDRAARRRLVSVQAALALVFLVGSIQYNPGFPGDSIAFLFFGAMTVAAGAMAVRGVRVSTHATHRTQLPPVGQAGDDGPR